MALKTVIKLVVPMSRVVFFAILEELIVVAPALAKVQEEDEAVESRILEALGMICSSDFYRYFDLLANDAG